MAVEPHTIKYWWRQEAGMLGGRWEHIVVSIDGRFEAKRYVDGALHSVGRIADLQIYEGKQLIEWYPLDGLGDGSERGPSP